MDHHSFTIDFIYFQGFSPWSSIYVFIYLFIIIIIFIPSYEFM